MPDSLARQPLATWNPARGVWETTQVAICGHLEPYSQTWPKWGMTRRGVAFALPTPAHPTDGYESSSLLLLPTVKATSNENRQSLGYSPNLGMVLLPTPTVNNHKESGHCRDFGGDLTHALTCDCQRT